MTEYKHLVARLSMTIKSWALIIVTFLLNLHPAFAKKKEMPFKLVEG